MNPPINALLNLMARLRDPAGGCPWDLEQDMKSLTRYTVEEVFEVVECIETNDLASLPDELGDLLFQIVFYAQIAEEEGRFNFEGIVTRIVDKLTRRHPHVFGDEPRLDAVAQSRRWEALKSVERDAKAESHAGAMSDVPQALPALMRAAKLQGRAARCGFDWPEIEPVLAKLDEEIEELEVARREGSASAIEAELGDVLFTCVNLARHLGMDAETALRRANLRFETRFHHMERGAMALGTNLADCTPEQQEAFWLAAKQALG